MNDNLKNAIILAGKITNLRATLAGLLNCKASDTEINKTIAVLMQAEGLNTATVHHAGRTYSATVRAGSKDTETFDSDTAKAMMLAAGMELPMRPKKGAAATALIK